MIDLFMRFWGSDILEIIDDDRYWKSISFDFSFISIFIEFLLMRKDMILFSSYLYRKFYFL